MTHDELYFTKYLHVHSQKKTLSHTHPHKQQQQTKGVIVLQVNMFFFNHFNLLIRCRSSVIKTFGKEANLIKEYYFWNNVRGKTFLSNLCHARISEPFDLFCTTHKGRSFSQYYYAVHKIMRSFRKYTCKHVRPLGQSEICGLF